MILFFVAFFNDFFSDSFSSLSINQRQVLNGGCYYIVDCIFANLSISNGNGGAICLNECNAKIVIEDTMIFNCGITGTTFCGGGVYFYCIANGEIVFNKVCANSCYSNSYNYPYGDQFARSTTSSNGKNYGILISITQCSPLPLTREKSFTPENGHQEFKYMNSSWNYPKFHSSAWYINPTSHRVLFCTTVSNQCTWVSIYFWKGSNNTYYMSNIVNNSQESTSYGVIFIGVNGQSAFSSFICCNFLNNAKTGNKVLFSGESGSLSVIQCAIDCFSSNTFVNTPGGINSYSSSIHIKHFETIYCPVLNDPTGSFKTKQTIMFLFSIIL